MVEGSADFTWTESGGACRARGARPKRGAVKPIGVLGLALLLWGAEVRASPTGGETLTVSLTGCPSAPVDVNEFLSAVELELDLNERPRLSQGELPAAIAIRVDCRGRASIRVRIRDTTDAREVRIDDVPIADRPRVLALVVAELVRSGAPRATTAANPSERRAGGAPAKPNTSEPGVTGGSDVQDQSRALPLGDGMKPSIGGWAHMSSRAGNALYGGAAGIDWRRSRARVEVGFAYAERARGSITSGLAAARYRHAARLIENASVGLSAALSSAAGVTWAIGDSRVPGVVVRRALFPYADVRVELALELWPAGRVTPELALYSGGAVGLLSTNAGERVLSSGGWLLGAGIGAAF